MSDDARTKGRITFKEDGDANHYSMLTEDGRWWLAVLANGEQTSERQIANFRRLAACWNRLEQFTTEQIEDPGYDLTGTAVLAEEMRSFSVQHQKLQCRFNQIEEERDQLQRQLEAERASLFAESQRKQQLEQQCAQLLAALEATKAPLEMYRAYGWTDRNGVIGKVDAAIAEVKGSA